MNVNNGFCKFFESVSLRVPLSPERLLEFTVVWVCMKIVAAVERKLLDRLQPNLHKRCQPGLNEWEGDMKAYED